MPGRTISPRSTGRGCCCGIRIATGPAASYFVVVKVAALARRGRTSRCRRAVVVVFVSRRPSFALFRLVVVHPGGPRASLKRNVLVGIVVDGEVVPRFRVVVRVAVGAMFFSVAGVAPAHFPPRRVLAPSSSAAAATPWRRRRRPATGQPVSLGGGLGRRRGGGPAVAAVHRVAVPTGFCAATAAAVAAAAFAPVSVGHAWLVCLGRSLVVGDVVVEVEVICQGYQAVGVHLCCSPHIFWQLGRYRSHKMLKTLETKRVWPRAFWKLGQMGCFQARL